MKYKKLSLIVYISFAPNKSQLSKELFTYFILYNTSSKKWAKKAVNILSQK